jgi:hypothetical protein
MNATTGGALRRKSDSAKSMKIMSLLKECHHSRERQKCHAKIVFESKNKDAVSPM